MKKFLALFLVLCILAAPLALADDVWSMAESQQYGQKAGGMLGRGLLNLGTSFVDVIVQTVQGTKDGPPFIGTVTGLGKGIGCTALRAVSGALDIVTFWVPGFNGFAVCKSYVDCINCGPTAQAAPAYQPPPAAAEPAPAHENAMKYVKK